MSDTPIDMVITAYEAGRISSALQHLAFKIDRQGDFSEGDSQAAFYQQAGELRNLARRVSRARKQANKVYRASLRPQRSTGADK